MVLKANGDDSRAEYDRGVGDVEIAAQACRRFGEGGRLPRHSILFQSSQGREEWFVVSFAADCGLVRYPIVLRLLLQCSKPGGSFPRMREGVIPREGSRDYGYAQWIGGVGEWFVVNYCNYCLYGLTMRINAFGSSCL